jgi:flagellar motor switch protein FliM
MRIGQIVQLVPGTMLQFDKACDEPLTLEVAGRTIASGDAVKVGDKFGIKLRGLEPPPPTVQTARQGTLPSPATDHR